MGAVDDGWGFARGGVEIALDIRPREGNAEADNVGGMRGNQKDEFVLRIGGTMRDVEEDGREGIEHGGYILIGGIPLDQGEVFLSIFERDGDVF